MQLEVVGLRDLFEVRRRLVAVSDAKLGKPMARELKATVKPLETAIRAEAADVAPGGYKPVLSRSVRFRQAVRSSNVFALVTVRVFGDGRRQRRDIPAVNKGIVRHPLWGNRRFWYAQRVRAGFVDRPWGRHGPAVTQAGLRVVDDFVAKI